MFSPQQLQQQLLHLLQHHPQQQPAPPPASRGVTPSQQQQMLNLRATSHASLLNANPLLQRALLMQQVQGNLRGFSMAASPMLQQFFPQATRHSLLGAPPVGVSLKPTRLAFPGLPFQRQNRTFRKDFQRVPERKREADAALSCSSSQGAENGVPLLEASVTHAVSEEPSLSTSDTPAEASLDDEPAAKRRRSGDDASVPDGAMCLEQVEDSSIQSQEEEADPGKAHEAADSSIEKALSEELKTSEVVSTAGLLKVTIKQSSESRAISTMALKPAHWTAEVGSAEVGPESALKFYCYICKTNCCNQQNFQAHMAGLQHQQRLQEIQRMSNICFVSLLPMVKEQRLLAEKDGDGQQRWCNTCQIHFTGDLIKHRRTQEHKLAKRSLRPFCTVCSRHFKTPRKFVEHMKSQDHKQKAKEVRLGEKEQGGPEDSEELITVDAIGCFEDDEEEEEEEEETEEEEEVEQLNDEGPSATQAGFKEAASEVAEGNEKYCPDSIYGPEFLVPVAGFLCRLCHKFYHSDSAARLAHCKSLMHFENVQRYKAARLPALPEVSSCPQQELCGLQNSPAAKMEDPAETASVGQESTVLAEACGPLPADDLSMVQRDTQAVVGETRGPLLIQDGGQTVMGDGSLDEDTAVVMREELGLGAQPEDPGNEPNPQGIAGRVSAAEGDSGPNVVSSCQGLEEAAALPALAKGEASAGRRRSARRRAR